MIYAEKLINKYDLVTYKLKGENLENQCWLGISDPYIEMYKHFKTNEDKDAQENEYVLVYRSEVTIFY